MSKFKCITSDNIFDAVAGVFAKIDLADVCVQNIVFVPSGQVKWAEKLLFEVKKTKVLFNVKVTTISDFISAKTKQSHISALWQKMLVKLAIMQTPDLSVLGGQITDGFLDKVVFEIKRFEKACLKPEDIENVNAQSIFLKQKLQDLAKIFKNYLSILNNNCDEAILMHKFLDLPLKKNKQNFFFVGFKAFSNLEQKFVLKLLNLGSINLAVVTSNKAENAYVYETPNWIINLEKAGVNVEWEEAQTQMLNTFQNQLKNQCFSVEESSEILNFVNVFECADPKEEVFNMARTIKALAYTQQICDCDVRVVCGDLKIYAPIIEKVFAEFNINFSVNAAKGIEDTALARFVIDVLMFLQENKWESLLDTMLSSFSGIDKEKLNKIIEFYEFNKPQNFALVILPNQIQQILSPLIQKLEEIKKCKTFLRVQKILEVFLAEKISNNIYQTLIEDGHAFEGELALFAPKALSQAAEKLLQFLPEDVDEKEYLEMFVQQLGFQTFQTKASGVYVTDIFDLPQKAQFLFVVGANQGIMPSSKNDTDILTDEEIFQVPALENLTTTLNVNRQNRFCVLQALMAFDKRLFISFSLADQQGQKLLPSVWVQGLIKNLDKDGFVVLADELPKNFEYLSFEEKMKNFAYSSGCFSVAKTQFLKNKKSLNRNFLPLQATLESFFETTSSVEEILQVENPKELFFPENKIQISHLEKYFDCPFKHFLAYGLKLKENFSINFQANDVGNVVHKVAEMFLQPQNNFLQSGILPEQAVNQIFSALERDERYKKLFLPQNAFTKQIVQEECVRFCKHLLNVNLKSAFKPKFLEMYFGKTQKFTLKVLNQDFSVVGVVDRVDVCQNNAVVIDYKTADNIKGNSQELFYGEKLQIFVYAKALETIKNLNVQGVFYLPVLNKFYKENEPPYFLRGKNVNTENFLMSMDKTICIENPKSSFFPCEIKTSKNALKNESLQFKDKNNYVSVQCFDDMINYAVEMAKGAITEILQGSLSPLPTKTSCERCPYVSVCTKSAAQLARKRCFDVQDQHFALYKQNLRQKEGNDEQH